MSTEYFADSRTVITFSKAVVTFALFPVYVALRLYSTIFIAIAYGKLSRELRVVGLQLTSHHIVMSGLCSPEFCTDPQEVLDDLVLV
jgi:uncharacterized membrane protein YgaE (UPF0421/DUF939 family)